MGINLINYHFLLKNSNKTKSLNSSCIKPANMKQLNSIFKRFNGIFLAEAVCCC